MPPTYSPSKALLHPAVLYLRLRHHYRNLFGNRLEKDGSELLIYLQTQALPEK